METKYWYGVPEEKEYEWNKAFDHANEAKEGIFISSPCPICFKVALRHFYDYKRGLWQWCGSCMRYAHYQAETPDWWDSELTYERSRLTAEPAVLEEAIRKL